MGVDEVVAFSLVLLLQFAVLNWFLREGDHKFAGFDSVSLVPFSLESLVVIDSRSFLDPDRLLGNRLLDSLPVQS